MAGRATPPSTSAILFNELVLAHFRWFTLSGRFGEFGGLPASLAPAGWPPNQEPTPEERKEAEDRYYEKLKEFTDSEGEIIAAYWSVKVPSGIVMTIRPRGRVLNFLRGPTISLHRATTWLTGSDSRVAELLHHCDTLGNKAAHILTRTPKRVAMTWIFSTESYLLGVIEGRSCGPIPPPSQTNGSPEPETAAGRKSASEVVAMSVADGTPPAGLATESAAEAPDDGLHCPRAHRDHRDREVLRPRRHERRALPLLLGHAFRRCHSRRGRPCSLLWSPPPALT